MITTGHEPHEVWHDQTDEADRSRHCDRRSGQHGRGEQHPPGESVRIDPQMKRSLLAGRERVQVPCEEEDDGRSDSHHRRQDVS